MIIFISPSESSYVDRGWERGKDIWQIATTDKDSFLVLKHTFFSHSLHSTPSLLFSIFCPSMHASLPMPEDADVHPFLGH